MPLKRTLFEVHNLTTKTDSLVGAFIGSASATQCRDKWAASWPSNRYEVYRADYHGSNPRGAFISVTGPGIEGAAEYSAPELRKFNAMDKRLSAAIAYTIEKVAEPGLAAIVHEERGLVFWQLACGLYQVNRDRTTPPPNCVGYGDLDALKKLKGL